MLTETGPQARVATASISETDQEVKGERVFAGKVAIRTATSSQEPGQHRLHRLHFGHARIGTTRSVLC